ncbi:glycerol-3-phosphate cytidylyltransferase [Paracoccus onubensis]|uniref:glycerol-3-phosphate cytidylyltransferase n=1 Tax=Paracoccus onubensis TaxID=1675788 RepID=UPI0027308DB7|nr:glycerol-3-phosphate cytidylyltransferase [Paracoccus onubensis]MDP0929551.1 glycerol-3-phosphate cytidylyltransferase [Paracoccus onubensis]
MRRVLTYGTFDTLHYGHIRLLQRARALGDYLIVGLSTDEFNIGKNKQAFHSWEERKAHLEALRYVDLVIPEKTWEQKPDDVKLYHVDVFTMGTDWKGKFDELGALCEVIYLERTNGISSTMIRTSLQSDDSSVDIVNANPATLKQIR